jgi:PAS domain S-box-containing protein
MPSNPFARLIKPDPYQDFFRVLADSVEDAVIVLSADGEQILAFNHAFLLLTGHARPELEGLGPAALFPGEAGQQALDLLLSATDQPAARREDVSLRRRDGQMTLVDVEARPAGAPRTAFLLTVRPSADRRQREEEDRTSLERLTILAHIAEALRDGTPTTLTTCLSLASEMLHASACAVYRVSPTSPDYVLDGQLPAEFPRDLPTSALPPLHRPTAWTLGERPDHALHKSARAAGLSTLRTAPLGISTAWVGALVAGWRDPSEVPPDARPLMEVVASLCDVAIQLGQQKAAMAELENNGLLLETEVQGQFAASADALLLLSPELRILRSNPAAHRLLGYRPEEIEQLPVQEVLVGPEDIMATFLDALGHDRQAEQSRLTLHRRDGTPMPVNVRAVPIPSPVRPRLLVVLSDQSERQAMEDRTETLAQRALLGEVTAIFAHEVRNPINNITTGVQLVASRLGKDHPQYEALDRVRKECTRLDQLMADVLFFARPLELRIEPLNVTEMIQRLLARWEPRFKQAGVTCHTAFDATLPPAAADARTLEQVIVNLITNALQAMPAGGTLSIKLAPAILPQGQMVEMQIADTGTGIPPEIKARIFDPFFTTKKDGTGLGLAISRRILTAHKGTIQVESYADAGTVFTLQIPAVQSTGSQA